MRLVSSYTGALLAAAHAGLALIWLTFLPGGFPIDHPRFWVNRALPGAFVAFCLWVGVTSIKRDRKRFRSLLILIAAFWLTIATTSLFIFPAGRIKTVPCAALPAILVLLAAFSSSPQRSPISRTTLISVVASGVFCGLFVSLAQRAPAPSTLPLNQKLPAPPATAATTPSQSKGGFTLTRSTGEISLQRSHYIVSVAPLLTFSSRSPDRGWTNMVTARDREGPQRQLVNSIAMPDGGTWAEYADDDRSILQTTPRDDGLELCSWSRLPRDVNSHLNSFTQITVDGHSRLELVFSPCPRPIEPLFSEYPIGAPSQCAVFLAGDQFSVLRASSAEKGPFTTLVNGTMRRADPLTLTLRDDGHNLMEITWFDFAAQASTALSPTAGYGLPMNAIEFSLFGPQPSSTMGLSMTLAGTSVGRGWDSVGHRAGVYRNRMRIRWLID